ncbi:GL16173 [Drosophila persimilis]|uniref:GL16173 n=1 Tax=Drosophila persimilis TaxID=7234 RepID=B4GQJ5_DROPE|nr:GL16173 [Drosophila persimilis]
MSDKYAVPNKLPGKTVSVLKHRKRRILQDQAVIEQKKNDRIKRRQKTKTHHKFRRAESFVMGYLKAERTSNRIRQTILKTNVTEQSAAAADDSNPKLLFVMRHAGKKIFDKTTTDIFKTLRMGQRHNAVFLENTKENQLLLRVIEPFVAYGNPSLSTIRELVFKKGFARIDGKKTAIQSNTMVEEHLGEKGVICLEDIIHEICTVGPNFAAVTQFLCAFTMSSPRNGWQKKVSGFIQTRRGVWLSWKCHQRTGCPLPLESPNLVDFLSDCSVYNTIFYI